jgi:hypothetical protein
MLRERFLTLVLAVLLPVGLSGCSTYDELMGAEPETTAAKPVATEAKPAEAAAPAAFPNLSQSPDAAQPSTTPAQRREIRDGLVADREKASHTAETLRGGQAPAATPPPPASATDAAVVAPAAEGAKPAATTTPPATPPEEGEKPPG